MTDEQISELDLIRRCATMLAKHHGIPAVSPLFPVYDLINALDNKTACIPASLQTHWQGKQPQSTLMAHAMKLSEAVIKVRLEKSDTSVIDAAYIELETFMQPFIELAAQQRKAPREPSLGKEYYESVLAVPKEALVAAITQTLDELHISRDNPPIERAARTP